MRLPRARTVLTTLRFVLYLSRFRLSLALANREQMLLLLRCTLVLGGTPAASQAGQVGEGAPKLRIACMDPLLQPLLKYLLGTFQPRVTIGDQGDDWQAELRKPKPPVPEVYCARGQVGVSGANCDNSANAVLTSSSKAASSSGMLDGGQTMVKGPKGQTMYVFVLYSFFGR